MPKIRFFTVIAGFVSGHNYTLEWAMHSKLQISIYTTVLREHLVSYALEEIACVGYQSAEIWLWDYKQWDEEPASLAHQARDLGITLSIHAPAGIVDPISTDLELVQEAQRQLAESLEIAIPSLC